MREHTSLKQRLLLLAMTTVVLVWVVATTFTYFDAREEFDEVLDAHLAQSAALLLIQASEDIDEVGTEHAPLLHKYSRRVAFQVWSQGMVLRLHSANAPAQPLANREQGFSDSVIDGKRWRVFSTWDESHTNLIHVAERAEVRDELAGDIAENLLKPLLISLPLLALLLWIAVAHGLRPLVKLTAEVEQREPENLAPLNAGSAPREVVPLIDRLNKLFERIDASMQKERRFTADAAHELRTPVAGIKAQAQVARAAIDDAERIHALDNAILGCDRAAHLIEQLLTLARIDTLGEEASEACQLKSLAAEVIAAIAPTALNENVHLELLEGDEVEVRGNPLLLRILLRNLIDNAVRHTLPETTVTVSVTRANGQVLLAVSDNGPGIQEADLAKVSERFYRPVGTRASGSGLGLSIVKRIAEIHHASLHLAALQPGSGLQVTLVFAA
ncbi:MAG: ATP-binding protein [Gallionellaceae bacterium]|jgi:two-component system sensor histidine kinase QseC